MIVRKILGLAFSNTMAQLLLIISMPVLANLYGAEAFGEFSVFLSVSVVVMSYCYMKMDFSILLSSDENTRRLIMTVGGGGSLILSIISSVCVALFMGWSIDWCLMLTLYCFFNSVFILKMSYYVVEGNIKKLGLFNISRSLIFIFFQFFLFYVFVFDREVSLIVALLFSYFLLVIPDVFSIVRIWLSLTKKDFAQVIGASKANMTYSTMNSLVSAVSNFTNVYFINGSLGSVAAGMYFLIMRMFQTPIGIVSKAISDSMLSSSKNNELYEASIFRVTIVLILVAALGFGGFLAFGQYVFDVILKSEWHGIYDMSLVLLPWLILQFINPALMSRFRVYNYEYLNLLVSALSVLVKVVVIYFFDFDVVLVVAVVGVSLNIVLCFLSLFLRDKSGFNGV